MKTRSAFAVFALGLVGCGSIGEELGIPRGDHTSQPPGAAGPAAPAASMDTRPVQTALRAPPPISGGTLMITRDGQRAVAADPDRDRVSIVRLDTGTVTTVALNPGDEPGRVVEDGNGRAHVALRRGGALVTIDLATGAVVARRDVCGAPRGLVYEPTTDLVHVACSSGELVSLPAGGGDAVRTLRLDIDLRDVVLGPSGGLLVSRFKSGDVLSIDANGTMIGRTKLQGIERNSDNFIQFSQVVDPIEPAVAWRMLSAGDGTALMLHQYGLASTIKISVPHESDPIQQSPDGPTVSPPAASGESGSPYGAPPGGCGGLVQAAVSQVSADGSAVAMGAPVVAGVLSVDASVSPDGSTVALAEAGLPQQQVFPENSQSLPPQFGGVTLFSRFGLIAPTGAPSSCVLPSLSSGINGQVTAVAFNPSPSTVPSVRTWLAIQTREPAKLVIFPDSTGNNAREIALGGESVLDTGHELFHRDAGGGIACASCHAEGGEDGRVWRFDTVGDRRTQAVHVGLKGTEPFHWDGDMANFGALVDEVMVRRMGGVPESDERKLALQNWLFTLQPPAPIVAADDPAVVRGRALFESPDVGCSGCHSGPKLTSNQTVFVGTTDPGHFLQVPSLHGVAYRAPFLHNGCAATLRDRFDPGCGGGDQHGHTSQLTGAQVTDLVAYLDSL